MTKLSSRAQTNQLVAASMVVLCMLFVHGTNCGAAQPTPPKDVLQIHKMIAAGQFAQANAELDRLIAVQPDNAAAYYLKGQALERTGKRTDAIAAYETASLLNPSAQFCADCKKRMAILATAPVAAPSSLPRSPSIPINKAIKNGKQVTPFQLHSEQSRMATQISDRYRKELQSEVGRLQDLASNGPIPSGIGANFVPPPRSESPPDNGPRPEQLASSIAAGRLTDEEKEKLAKYDVIFVVDHSGSMGQKDCPQNSSRWSWLAAQVSTIGRDANECFPRGLNVVMFDDNAEEFARLKPEEFLKLFSTYGPAGGTNTGHAVRSQLRNVQSKLAEKRPVMLVCITDGLPNNPIELQEAFQELKQLAGQSGTVLKVSLLHIGASAEGLKTLSQLQLLASHGIGYGKGFVQLYPFSDLTKYGLARALLKILND